MSEIKIKPQDDELLEWSAKCIASFGTPTFMTKWGDVELKADGLYIVLAKCYGAGGRVHGRPFIVSKELWEELSLSHNDAQVVVSLMKKKGRQDLLVEIEGAVKGV